MLALFKRRFGRYAEPVSLARRSVAHVPQQTFPRELEGFEGRWVAVRNHEVIADAATSSEVMRKLRDLDESVDDVAVQFVRPETGAYIVGVG